MSMYENPSYFGEDQEDQDPLFPQLDPVQRAAEEQREKLQKEAEKQAEKDAKEAKKKADKEARIAQKMADKVAKDLEKKSDKVAETSEEAKDKVADAKEAVADMSKALNEQSEALSESADGAPVEMAFTNGSEYISELKEGEEAIFDLSQSVERVEEVIELADEVTAKAEALAKARAALGEVVSGDMGVESISLEESRDAFGAQGPAQDLRDRLRNAWEPTEESVPTTETSTTGSVIDSSSVGESVEPIAPTPSPEPVSSYGYGGGYEPVRPTKVSEYGRPESTEPAPATHSGSLQRGVRTATAFAGGLFAGRAGAQKRELESVEATLKSQTTELSRDVASVSTRYEAPSSVESLPLPAPTAEGKPRPVTIPAPEKNTFPEKVLNNQQDAIPSWIRQVESDVKKGRVVELKKWQRDVLKSQHPELLKKYDLLDNETKRNIRSQSIEQSKSTFQNIVPKAVTQAHPGDLPSFASPVSMPAFMQPSRVEETPVVRQPLPARSPYEYSVATSSDTVFSNAYITIVSIGGLLFGALLISAFGL